MFQIKVNNKHNYAVGRTGDKLTINDELMDADVKQINPTSWHIINELGSYNVELVNLNSAEKTAEIKVNGNIYSVTAKDQFDLLLDKLGLSDLNTAKISDLKAPMPGL